MLTEVASTGQHFYEGLPADKKQEALNMLAQAQESAVEWLGKTVSSDERKGKVANLLAETGRGLNYAQSGERIGVVNHMLERVTGEA